MRAVALTRANTPSPQWIGRLAIHALRAEIALYPKPGLVSPRDSGAHHDMDYGTFLRSLFALETYFPDIARAGGNRADFACLQRLGLQAEARMLAATGGINTHRGAIFSLGLISAAAGAFPGDVSSERLCAHIRDRWGAAILAATPARATSNGLLAARTHSARGAREEAAAGFPLIVEVALPFLRQRISVTDDLDLALVDTLFLLISRLDDTNLLHRGGRAGLEFARQEARKFLDHGGTSAPGWYTRAGRLHAEFIRRKLSPGGSSDMLAATLFLHGLAGRQR